MMERQRTRPASAGRSNSYTGPVHAPAFHCPACGGPQRAAGPGRCEFCGSARVPLGVPDPRTANPCPDCARLVAADHRFCPHCGAVQGDADPPVDESDLRCPGCSQGMSVWPLDARLASSSGYRGSDPQVHGCQGCGGAWVDRRTLDTIIAEARAQARNVDPSAVPRKTMALDDVVVYRPCPRCSERMNRRNFGRYSGVVVDECSRCGTYFDVGELAGVVAFVRGGGLTLTERRDADEARRELEQRRRMLATADTPSQVNAGSTALLELQFDLLIGFLRWVGRWIRRLST
jgi:Zn-finger nucleic acid-binding protein